MRKSTLVSVCVAALMVAMFAAPSLGGVTVFLSEVTTIGGGATMGNPNVNATIGVPFSLGVWVSSPVDVLKVNGMALDLYETLGILSATGIEIMESGQTGKGARWEGTTDGNLNMSSTELFSGSNTVGVENMGLTDVGFFRTGDGNYDPAADDGNGAFLFAILEIMPTALGDTNLFLHVGERKIGFSPDTDPNISFGTGDDPISREIEGAVSSVADGSVHVIPEPATVALLALGGVAVLIRRRRVRG